MPPEVGPSFVKVVTGTGWTVQNLSEHHKFGERSGRVNRYMWVSITIKVRHNIGILKAVIGQSPLCQAKLSNLPVCTLKSRNFFQMGTFPPALSAWY